MSPEPAPLAPNPHHLQAIGDLAARYGWRLLGDPRPVADSVSNSNYRVDTHSATFFVRVHKKRTSLARIEREHAAIRWAGDHGIPVNLPLADRQGRAIHSLSGVFYAVFSWLEGATLQRGSIDPAGAQLLGEMHGQLHAVLAGYPSGRLERGSETRWDAAASLDDLTRVDDLIRYNPSPPPAQLAAQEALRFQADLLQSGAAMPASAFEHLPCQPVHGDFHERNLMLDARGHILAMVDWERVALVPAAFEIVRALSFMDMLEGELPRAYLAGYACHNHIPASECTAAVDMWWQNSMHNTWTFRARFIEGNREAERFIPEIVPRLRQLSDSAFRKNLARELSEALAP